MASCVSSERRALWCGTEFFWEISAQINAQNNAPEVLHDSKIAFISCRNLYELDTHLDRFLDSAAKAKILPPFNRAMIREILMQTVAAGSCKDGTLRFWLSAGRGNFELSTKNCEASLYACLLERSPIQNISDEKVAPLKVSPLLKLFQ